MKKAQLISHEVFKRLSMCIYKEANESKIYMTIIMKQTLQIFKPIITL